MKEGGIALFLMATYGEGDPTDSAVDFTKWLKATTKELDGSFADASAAAAGEAERGKPLSSSKLQYAVFGLGNRQYQYFNAMGKLTDARLEELGAKRFYTLGLGDDDADMEADWEQWRDGLWPALREIAPADGGAAGAAAGTGGNGAGSMPARRRGTSAESDVAGPDGAEIEELPSFPWEVEMLPAGAGASTSTSTEPTHAAGTAQMQSLAAAADMTARHFFQAVPVPILENRELRQASGVGSSTRHVEMDLKNTGLSYMTADNLHICPENDPQTVAIVANACGFDLNATISLVPAKDSPAGSSAAPLFPIPITVRTMLTRYVDLNGEPKRQLLGFLAQFASNAAEKQRLLLLASTTAQGKAEFKSWIKEAQRSVFELFINFPSVKPSLRAFIHIMPRLQPRAYTIASSALVQPSKVAIVASVVDAPKPGNDFSRRLKGVCSNHLLRKADDKYSPQRLWVLIKASTFRLSVDLKTPVIMIGPGTGIAPFRGFLQERSHLRSLGKTVGPSYLYFGCQDRNKDFIYKDELQAYVKDGTLNGLYTAFSREGPTKVYVQHLMTDKGEEIADLVLKQNASIYVCGATKMGHDVQAAVIDILHKHGKLADAAAAKAYAEEMKKGGRYTQELWSS